jgi:hypothetical protein
MRKGSKRGRSDTEPNTSIPFIDTDAYFVVSGRLLDLPHDLIKASLEFVPYGELFRARLVSKKWAGAVADCVECSLSGLHCEGNKWRRTLVHGDWTPRSAKQFRKALCVLPQMTDTFRESIYTIYLRNENNSVRGLVKTVPSLKDSCTEFTPFRNLSRCEVLSKLNIESYESLQS